MRFRLGKRDGVTFALQAKTPGPHLDSQEVDISVDFAAALGERSDAYERLLADALEGSPRRFAREDIVAAHVAHRAAGPRRPGTDLPVLQGHDGPGRGRPPPRRRPVVPAGLTGQVERAGPADLEALLPLVEEFCAVDDHDFDPARVPRLLSGPCWPTTTAVTSGCSVGAPGRSGTPW